MSCNRTVDMQIVMYIITDVYTDAPGWRNESGCDRPTGIEGTSACDKSGRAYNRHRSERVSLGSGLNHVVTL